MIRDNVTGVDLQDRLAVIREWARDGQHAVSGEGGTALRCVEALCEVAAALADRVLLLETTVVNGHALAQAIRHHRDTAHLP